ncbi:hypothetical protein GE061_000661 [Apolygus lucorum]|uniref:Uncharacterized protein n=1 Tax=Apolygus lucorum TaxID=248454 RepID=A0A8S9Y4X5_APOLU|nr:hypothetical protein GE061_000661 [Apolygus lucorum]
MLMGSDEEVGGDSNVGIDDSRHNVVKTTTSGATEPKEESVASELDNEEETFVDAMSSPPETIAEAGRTEPQHNDLESETLGQPQLNPGDSTDKEGGTRKRSYELRQRPPVDYRKLHLGALIQTDMNHTN